ncbi:OLC1v1031320C1 [Oldenlandia corymbosa var. corymbosa]|uniref:OLC1v1031320C1 n=1 Tax=Oldenlandia corymbosa var. corymbosa TaxID=529605 RepID=A0AAV1CIC1_OLDCO|nr:OLC1v1031320C1 [Oldenlandia corymbosa var. corymbosa]
MRAPRDFGGEQDVVYWLEYFNSFYSCFPIAESDRFGCVQQSLVGVAQDWFQTYVAENEQLSRSDFSEKLVRRLAVQNQRSMSRSMKFLILNLEKMFQQQMYHKKEAP